MRADAVERQRQAVERALAHSREPRELEALAADLARLAPHGSPDWCFAARIWAQLLVDKSPWRASLLARDLTRANPHDHVAWGVLGLTQSLLGQHRFAVHAYEQARRLAPDQPAYLHNLGHLVDAALGEPERAIPILERAHRLSPDEPEVAASLAHALARAGETVRARTLLEESLAAVDAPTSNQRQLLEWLNRGAPMDEPPPSTPP